MGDSVAPPPGNLVIVTGPSHVGKSTLIRELLKRAAPPAATVAIDEVIQRVELPPEELWERGLGLAYDAAAAEVEQLLGQGTLVFYESTFTYVPPDDRPAEFHAHQLERLLSLGPRFGVRVIVLHLYAPLQHITRRQRETGRLSTRIAEEAWHQHATASVEASTLRRLNTSKHSPSVLADAIAEEVGIV